MLVVFLSVGPACTACGRSFAAEMSLDDFAAEDYVYILCNACGHIMVLHPPTRAIRDLTPDELVLMRKSPCAEHLRLDQEAVVARLWG